MQRFRCLGLACLFALYLLSCQRHTDRMQFIPKIFLSSSNLALNVFTDTGFNRPQYCCFWILLSWSHMRSERVLRTSHCSEHLLTTDLQEMMLSKRKSIGSIVEVGSNEGAMSLAVHILLRKRLTIEHGRPISR